MDMSRLAFCVRISGWTLCVNSSDFIYCSNIPLAIVSIVIETTRIVHHGRTRRTPFVKWTGHEMGKCFCAETRTSTYLNSHRLNELVLGNELWFYVWPSKSTALKTDRTVLVPLRKGSSHSPHVTFVLQSSPTSLHLHQKHIHPSTHKFIFNFHAKEKVDDDQSNGDATGLESCFENYANMAIILLGLIPEHRGLGTRKKSCFVHSSFRPMPNRGRRIPELDGHSRCCCSCGRKLNFMENSVKRNH